MSPKKAVGDLKNEAGDQLPSASVDTSGFTSDVGGAGRQGPVTCVWWPFACPVGPNASSSVTTFQAEATRIREFLGRALSSA